jgi:hypothetical protein
MENSRRMRKVEFEEISLGAVAGAVVASVGGLFIVGIISAIISQDPRVLFQTPIQSLISWLICTPLGWLIGGLIGPRLGERLKSRRAEIISGALGGLLPVLAIAVVGWYIGTHYLG